MSDTLKLVNPESFRGFSIGAVRSASRALGPVRSQGAMVAFLAWPADFRFRSFLVGALIFKGVYPFLAITHRVNAEVLVVEGWIHEYAIRAALNEFQNHYGRFLRRAGQSREPEDTSMTSTSASVARIS